MGWLSARTLFVTALAGWIAIAVLGVIAGHALGHDEAAYAALARDGNDAWIYRSDGMVAIARLGLLLGDAEWQLRLVCAVLGVGALLAVYAVGKVSFSAQTGAWAMIVLVSARPMVLRNSALLSDLPSMGLLLGGMALLLVELRRAAAAHERGEGDASGGISWRVLIAAPIFAASFYVRYGSAPTVMIIALAPVILWWKVLRRRPAPYLAMLALLGLLVAPHLLRSLWATGSPMGILELSAEVSGRAYVGDGLVTYLTSNPFRYYGLLVAPLMVMGLARPFWRSGEHHQARVPAYLALVAVAQLVVLGLQSHAESRYVFVASSLLALLGVDLLRAISSSRSSASASSPSSSSSAPSGSGRRGAIAALGISSVAWAVAAAAAWPHFQRLDEERAPIVATARAMRANAAGQGCTAISWKAPQLVWYSGCLPLTLPRQAQPADHLFYVASFAHRPMPISEVLAPGQHACPLAAPDASVQLWRLDAACAPL